MVSKWRISNCTGGWSLGSTELSSSSTATPNYLTLYQVYVHWHSHFWDFPKKQYFYRTYQRNRLPTVNAFFALPVALQFVGSGPQMLVILVWMSLERKEDETERFLWLWSAARSSPWPCSELDANRFDSSKIGDTKISASTVPIALKIYNVLELNVFDRELFEAV